MQAADTAAVAWWIWPIALFAVTFALGIVSVMAGVGGGALFVPVVASFFPFHLDFARGAGLLIALAGALSAAPSLLASGLASLRLAMPFALIGSVTAIGGAVLGLALPTAMLQVALGVTIVVIAGVMLGASRGGPPRLGAADPLATALRLHGVFHDHASGRDVEWRIHRTGAGLVAFAGIGALAGMFGIGAGWANVPALNLLMGAPLKLSVGTSGIILSVVDSSAAWVYLHHGAILPILVVPSLIGVMLGARVGARLLRSVRTAVVRHLVVALLLVAGTRILLKGLGVWT